MQDSVQRTAQYRAEEAAQEMAQDSVQNTIQELGKDKERRKRLQVYRRLTAGDGRTGALSGELYRESSGTGDDPDLRMTAGFVLAPVLCMYVDWVLEEAVREGKERLYFLARDGYQMYRVAQVLCRKRGLSVECRYLYCSRYALRTAEYHLLKKECLDLICLDGMQITFSGLVERAGLGKERVWDVAGLTGWKGDVNKPLCARQLRELKDWLYGCRAFLELVWEASKERFPLVSGYLEQEGLTEPVKWALVDSGWTGSIQRSFGHLLGAMGCGTKVEGYYFGMYEYPRDMARQQYHPWLFSPEKGLGRMAHFNNNLFECIFSAPEGMTVGYAFRDGRYVPVLAQAEEGNCDRVSACGRYLLGYAEKMGAAPPGGGRKLASRLLRPFMCRPTSGEAAYFGSLLFWDDVAGDGELPLAWAQTAKELREGRLVRRALKRFGGVPQEAVQSAWQEGSAVLSGRRGELWHSQAYRYVLCARRRWKAGRTARCREGVKP